MKRLLLLILAATSMLHIATGQTDEFAKWRELRDKVWPIRGSLESAAVLYDSEKWYAQSYALPDTDEAAAKFLADLATIENLIMGSYAGVKAPTSYNPRNILEHPEEWATICKAREQLVAKVRGAKAAEMAADSVKFIKDMTATVKSNHGWGLGTNGLLIVIGKREDARKALCGGQKIDGWDAACDELLAVAKSVAATARPYANYSNEFCSDLIKNGWAKNYPTRKIVRIATAKSDWTVVKDSLGRPKYRSMGVAVQYRIAGFDYVIEQTVSILQDYVGNGEYKYRATAQVPDNRILKGK